MLTKGLGSISFCNMSAAAGIGATSISTIEGTLRNSRFYDSKYPLDINWIIAKQCESKALDVDEILVQVSFTRISRHILDWYQVTGNWKVW